MRHIAVRGLDHLPRLFRHLSNQRLLKSHKPSLYVRSNSDGPHSSMNRNFIDISDEVSTAVSEGQPVVTLESAIITHGMPNPVNIETALRVQEIVRENGAVPATVAIVKGRIKVGLDDDMLIRLGTEKADTLKTSYRDLPYVLSQKMNGGTTVSTTVAVSKAVGIPVMVTGGIGGVHRGGETTMDVSADLIELGCSPVGVVCSGAKSILDIARTLEYLETQGVMVATYGSSRHFPAFYSQRSGFLSPYHVENTEDAAGLIHVVRNGNLQRGVIIAVPVPKESAIPSEEMEEIIKKAVEEANSKGVKGKDVTPFVLSHVVKSTSGRSLTANVALIQNNAQVGAKIAVDLSKLNLGRCPPQAVQQSNDTSNKKPDVVVIGGAVVDNITKLSEPYKVS